MSIFGQNAGYVDELYARYLADPDSVSDAWREFFEGYRPEPAAPAPREPAVADAAPVPGAVPLRGAAARLAENMRASLAVPTATTVRTVAVQLLDENRRILNQHRTAMGRSKVSITHLVAWAILRALERFPSLNGAYAEIDGEPHRIPRGAVNLGIAVDLEKRGERALVVPNLKGADRLDFPSFVAAYDDLVARARQGRLVVDDFAGTTLSVTNPGTLGTTHSVPRLMEGQGAIVGIGAVGYPPQYAGMSPEALGAAGLSRTMTVTSTYDHRIVQGAESGLFLARVDALLSGADGFYEGVFEACGVPHDPLRAAPGDAPPPGAASVDAAMSKQAGVLQLIRAHRVRGHLSARIDPLGSAPLRQPELDLGHYGLSLWDLGRGFETGEFAGRRGPMPLREILEILRDTYCGHVGVEFMHIQEPEIRHWLQERMESTRNAAALSPARQARILAKLNAAEAFETFLHATYVGHKRFSLEGAESLVPMLDAVLDDAGAAGIEETVIGMAHRGRLNVLCNVLGKSYAAIFREFEGEVDPDSAHGSGDVKYHLGATGTHLASEGGTTVRLTLASNPSHLEAVDPVVEGMVRAKQDRMADLEHVRVLPLLIHGDSAFAGQGVVAETLNLSQLRGYRTGGTLHLVVNNQIGFTTGPRDARSSPYATDVARTTQAPIFHVNGDHPEGAVRVARLALEFRNRWKRDAVVDLVCYRRWGHNEADDPSYTHPRLYATIERHRSVRKLYTEDLLRRGELSPDEAERTLQDFRGRLDAAFAEVKAAAATPFHPPAPDETLEVAPQAASPVTAVGREILDGVLERLDRTPEGFEIHPKLARQLARRRTQFAEDRVDWALAEALALGTAALEGTRVRLSGEDSGRGTFSQRHAILYDFRTGEPFTPLAHLAPGQGRLDVYDSLLSEFAVLGFDYGYSVAWPESLVLWEAQFGDFVNGGQVILDQFLVAAEEKWRQTSAMTLLLPHGYEGQGPEHSSARIERFLQSCARGNIRVAQPSTPAQCFHLLRRQARASERKPLIVFTPKSLLRHPQAVSSVAALASGAFEPVLTDPSAAAAERLILASGRIVYDLEARRRELDAEDTTVVRLEQLYPFPEAALAAVLVHHAEARDVVWAQDEPRNMGAFTFVRDRLEEILGPGRRLRYAGRPRNASPATGSYRRHVEEQRALIDDALGVAGR